ncbi:hypothetical protein ABT095_18990 [Kitasatospora sp. NPDC002227]|uniref:hypothetical protein n=1 Tax=Kitasatospora sp. NPDC002227 TaxID=3154773 RepID=UPI0033242CBB
MLTDAVAEDSRLSYWRRVREYAVPPSMIETATARRLVGDWGGACAAAGVDVDLGLDAVRRAYGRALVAQLRADLRVLAPDLLRWNLPRMAPDGLLRPGVTVALARYETASARPLQLVARTAPRGTGQRISLGLWGGVGSRGGPHPERRYRLDLHRHLWDASRAHELRVRSGVDSPAAEASWASELVPPEWGCAVGRWSAEAALLLRAEGRRGAVVVRLGARYRLVLEVEGEPGLRVASGREAARLPVLPEAAIWTPPDLELLRAGLIEPGQLHPLVASALAPGSVRSFGATDAPGPLRAVDCRGARHHIGLVDGVLVALDHHPDEIRREELLAALGGPPLPCLREIDRAHRRPDGLDGVRERLAHGDTAGALAVVEGLLGPEALLRSGELRDALTAAAERRIAYGLHRAGLGQRALEPARQHRTSRRRAERHRTSSR